jgi:hypothetical protein
MATVAPAGWTLRFVMRQIIKRSGFPSPAREAFLARLKDRRLSLLEYDTMLDVFEAWTTVERRRKLS